MLFTKQIQIEPRFILVNESEYILHIRAIGAQHVAVELPPNKRIPYSKPAKDNEKHKVDEIFINMCLA
jgi:hypothetical protein